MDRVSCKLAHQNEVKQIQHFKSIKELYEKISQSFSIPINEILYCTLNTHDFRDMDALLGNYISSSDLIVVHLCGQQRTFSIKKVQEYLGLTITDNCIGKAFVKKVNPNDSVVINMIQPGDHIAEIDSESTLGKRHYEVARAIRDIPCNKTFTMTLVQPISVIEPPTKTFEVKQTTKQTMLPLHHAGQIYSLDVEGDELIDSSLPFDRLLSKRNNIECSTSNKSNADYRHLIDGLNSTLESLLGISDNLLAIRIYRLAKENESSYNNFSSAIKNSELSVFNFGEDIEKALWQQVQNSNKSNLTSSCNKSKI